MVDLNRISDKIAKMEQLKELLADPEMARLASEVLSGAQSNHWPQFPDIVDIVVGRPDSKIRKALEAVTTFTGKFTAQDLKDRMRQLNYQFKAEHPMIGVQRVLRHLVKDGIVTRVEEGAGRRPHIYERSPHISGRR